MTPNVMADPDFLRRLSRQLADEGKVMEAGWVGLRLACDLHDAPAIQLEEMRNAFFAGAQHVFSTIMTIMDQDREPTAADLRRVSQINDELEAFIADFSARRLPTQGGVQ